MACKWFHNFNDKKQIMDLMNKKQPNLQSKTINMTIWPELSAKMTMIDIQGGYSPFQEKCGQYMRYLKFRI